MNVVAQIEGIEWIILLVIIAAVLLWGPQKLPELARGMGRALGEFQRGRVEIEREIRTQFADAPATPARGRYQEAAQVLGVPSVGQSETQIKLGIARLLDQATDSQLSEIAKALGVLRSGSPSGILRDQIMKALR